MASKRPEEKKILLKYENELLWDFWGHIGLKQPRNHKFEIGYAQAESAKPHLNQYVNFISSRSFFTYANSES